MKAVRHDIHSDAVGLISRNSQYQEPSVASHSLGELQTILDSTPFLLTRCSRDLRYQYVSKAYAAMIGRTVDEVSGKPIVEIMGSMGFETIRPYVEAVLQGQRVEYEAEVHFADVGLRHLHVIYVPERDQQGQVVAWLASIVDITERKVAEKNAKESEDRFRTMANYAPVLLWMSDKNKLCTFFNQGWLTFTGRTMEQEMGNGWAEGVHPDDMQQCLEIYYSAFDARRPFEMEYRLRRHDGEYRWMFDRGVPRFASGGEFTGYVGSLVDISGQKEAEETARHLAHLQRLAAVGELTAAIAHEVRQPLAAMIANVDAAAMLLNSANPPLSELREIISDIRADDIRASEILTRIQGFTRKQDTHRQALDLNSIITDTLHLIAGDIRKRRVEIRADLAPGLPLVFAVRTQLQQVLINLVINGMDAMANAPQPDRHLTVQTARNGDDRIEVVLTDCGCGISPEILSHIFESFFTTKEKGTGLGLSIARSIVESHGGRIWAHNNPSGGATFHFTLPVVQTKSIRPDAQASREPV
jgi:PAS domain S-box-containing protein